MLRKINSAFQQDFFFPERSGSLKKAMKEWSVECVRGKSKCTSLLQQSDFGRGCISSNAISSYGQVPACDMKFKSKDKKIVCDLQTGQTQPDGSNSGMKLKD